MTLRIFFKAPDTFRIASFTVSPTGNLLGSEIEAYAVAVVFGTCVSCSLTYSSST